MKEISPDDKETKALHTAFETADKLFLKAIEEGSVINSDEFFSVHIVEQEGKYIIMARSNEGMKALIDLEKVLKYTLLNAPELIEKVKRQVSMN